MRKALDVATTQAGTSLEQLDESVRAADPESAKEYDELAVRFARRPQLPLDDGRANVAHAASDAHHPIFVLRNMSSRLTVLDESEALAAAPAGHGPSDWLWKHFAVGSCKPKEQEEAPEARRQSSLRGHFECV